MPTSSLLKLLLVLTTCSFLRAAEVEAYLRVAEEEDVRVALEVASRVFVPEGDADGPSIALVGVAHIGDASFYETLQEFLGQYDVVLYESVLPPGARGAGGETYEERRDSTRGALGFAAGLIEGFQTKEGRYPESPAELLEFTAAADERMTKWVMNAIIDAWGNAAIYSVTAEGDDFSLRSLGADGRFGGADEGADIEVTSADSVAPVGTEEGGNMQTKLAEVLDLAFQLEAMDYDQEGWIVSDMAMDEVEREVARRGGDFSGFAGALEGGGGMGDMMDTLMKMIPPSMRDTLKVLMIEILGDPEVTERAMEQQLGKALADVILRLRNETVIHDLEKLLAGEDSPESVAIFYGAAHMPDMEERLAAMGFREEATFWVPAIAVDLTSANVNQGMIQMMRMAMKQMMPREK